jgi:Ni/Fe-hydrogenase subunit HybB-like protein
MFGVIGATSPQVRQGDAAIQAMQLSLMAQLQADRNKRTLEASEEVSPVIWTTAIVTGFLVILMSFFLYPDRDWPHVVMSSMLAVMVFMLIYVVYIFSRPFSGLAPLRADAFEHSLAVYDSVDKAMG